MLLFCMNNVFDIQKQYLQNKNIKYLRIHLETYCYKQQPLLEILLKCSIICRTLYDVYINNENAQRIHAHSP